MSEWLEVIARSLLMLIVLFLLTKVLGKKQLSKLSYFEYIVGIIIGDVAGTLTMSTEASLFNGITSLGIWAGVSVVISMISLKSKAFRDVVEGKARIFIKDGKILEENLKKERISADELLEMLRKKDVFSANDVEFALLEADGELSVLLKRDYRAVRPSELWLHLPEEKEPKAVIMDGVVMIDVLNSIGRTREWLQSKLREKQVNINEIYLGQLHSDGRLTLDYYEDAAIDTKQLEE
ncbi:DUF421 domain-containing protein [Guptibacillus algicola]|uniref:DUF421 domain-containing protein n=1 Tax=Guptibacillus algicola TaxID=225844 RepID=UPI001CD66E53|nr:DUF421 domain-containing protein [Alkalihalobacillus algicola]MCA0987656.1 DUF421 domain-containing protein [Alkalihalobacillus algicola]